MRIVISGGTGFVGARLCERLVARGHEPIVLTRDASRSHGLHPRVRVVSWADGASWEGVVDGAGGIVNLAGENLARRWTDKAKQRIVASRLSALTRLHDAVARAATKPGVLVSASAVGYYGPHGDEELDESSPPGTDFLATTCRAWEEAAVRFEALGLRVVRVRIGLVLAKGGGALGKLIPQFQLFAGGPMGDGSQWTSWIHRDDLVDLIVFSLENPAASGPINATAPAPVTNRAFASALGRALHRPSLVPAPAFALKLLAGETSSVLLDGQRVLPKRATALGFTFRHTEIGEALRDVVAQV